MLANEIALKVFDYADSETKHTLRSASKEFAAYGAEQFKKRAESLKPFLQVPRYVDEYEPVEDIIDRNWYICPGDLYRREEHSYSVDFIKVKWSVTVLVKKEHTFFVYDDYNEYIQVVEDNTTESFHRNGKYPVQCDGCRMYLRCDCVINHLPPIATLDLADLDTESEGADDSATDDGYETDSYSDMSTDSECDCGCIFDDWAGPCAYEGRDVYDGTRWRRKKIKS